MLGETLACRMVKDSFSYPAIERFNRDLRRLT
jgi:hypothetical protein